MSNMHGTGGDRARLTGTRGGKDQFNWSNVKSDESRELYLGHSVHAPVGRWQKGRDLNWYAKKSTHAASAVDVAAQIAAERRAFKQQEEDQRLEALGMKPRKNRRIATGLDEMEKKQLLERGQTKEVEYMTEEDRMGGLGSEETHKHEGVKKTLSSMLTKINTMDQGAPDALPGHIDASLLGGRDSSAAGKLTARKEKKREAQERKKAKKVRKKEKKLKRKDDELRELDKRIAELQRQTSNQREGRHRSRSGSRGRKSSRRKSKSRSRGREDARSRSGSRRGRSRSRSPKRSRAR